MSLSWRSYMAKVGPLLFIQQVRNEVSKVTWPSRNETTLTSVIVIIFAIIASLFFFLSDQVMSFFIKLILGLGS
jgi:preprotein translocase subunit SecE